MLLFLINQNQQLCHSSSSFISICVVSLSNSFKTIIINQEVWINLQPAPTAGYADFPKEHDGRHGQEKAQSRLQNRSEAKAHYNMGRSLINKCAQT
jgi:hypothetical protein